MRVICKINLNTSAQCQLGNVREIFTESEQECSTETVRIDYERHNLGSCNSARIPWESKHVTAKGRKKRKRRGIKGRFCADGFLHPFVSMFSLRTIALHGAASAADAFPDCARTPSICAGRRFSSATGITRKLHPLFSQGAKDHSYENTRR